MDSFQHVMGLISVVVGLGVAHILSALGQAIHRRMGSGASIKLDATSLLWIGFVFPWLVSFWWFEYRFSEREVWTMGFYLFLLTYAVLLFLLAVVLVPFQLEGVSSTREHFTLVRPWFFGLLLAVNLLDLADTFLKSVDWGLRLSYLTFWGATTLVCVVGLLSRRSQIHFLMALVMFLWQLVYTFLDLGVLESSTAKDVERAAYQMDAANSQKRHSPCKQKSKGRATFASDSSQKLGGIEKYSQEVRLKMLHQRALRQHSGGNRCEEAFSTL